MVIRKKKKQVYDDSSIESMTALAGARFRSNMYIGDSTDPCKGQHHIIKEITDNAFDEVTANPEKQHTINITFLNKGKKYQVIVSDTGRGLPLGSLEIIFTTLHSSGKWAAAYGASSGTNGVGSVVAAAVSTKFYAVSKRPEGSACIFIKDCVMVSNEQTIAIDKDHTTDGSTVLLEPDPKVFSHVDEFIPGAGFKQFCNLMELIATFINNVKVNIYVNKGYLFEKDLSSNPHDLWHTLYNQHTGNLVYTSSDAPNTIDYIKKSFNIKTELLWSMTDCVKELNLDDEEDLLGYSIRLYIFDEIEKTKTLHYTTLVNNTPINDSDSHHISGLINVLKKKLVNYVGNKEFHNFFNHIYKLPIHCAILAQFKGAEFVNQTKTEFKNDLFNTLYTKSLTKTFDNYSDELWEDLYNVLEDDIQDKYNTYVNRSIKNSKGLKDISSRLGNSKCYIPCRSHDNSITELFITEGESAGGIVSTARDKDFQAVYKLRGKSLNTFKATNDRIQNSVIYNDLVKVLGVSPTDTNLDSLHFNKICILADADADGKAITILTIGNLYSINPLILEQGKVYVSNPPLYLLSAKNQSMFLRDNNALMDIKANMLYKQAIQLHLDFGGKITKLEGDNFKSFCYIIEHIGNIIDEVANSVNVEPYILEQLIHVIDYINFFHIDTRMIKKTLGVDSVIHHKVSNSLIIAQGGIEISISLTNLKEEITAYILPELEKIHWDKFNILVTTKHTNTYNKTPISIVSLYSVFQVLDERGSNNLFTISRFKGLGTSSPEMIAHTCLNPLTRSYTKITSIGDVNMLYDMLGAPTAARKKLLLA